MARFSSTVAQRAAGAAGESWLSRVGDALADWVLLLALLVAASGPSRPATALALVVLARVLPRLVLLLGAPALVRRITPGGLALLAVGRAVIAGVLALAAADFDLFWLVGAVLIYGTLSALSSEGRAALAPRRLSPLRLGRAGALSARVEAVGLVAGPALAAAVLWFDPVSTRPAFGLAALLLAGVAVALWSEARASLRAPQTTGTTDPPAVPRFDDDPPKAWRPLSRSNLSLVAMARFGAAAMATGVIIALLPLGTPLFDPAQALPGLALALVGVGAVAGLVLVPRTVPRLLGHVPTTLLTGGGVAATALGVIVLSLGRSLLLGALACLALGAVAVASDAIAAIVIKRQAADSGPGGGSWHAVLPIAGGQVAAAAVFAIGAASASDVTVLAVGVALGGIALVGLTLLIGEGRAMFGGQRAAAP